MCVAWIKVEDFFENLFRFAKLALFKQKLIGLVEKPRNLIYLNEKID